MVRQPVVAGTFYNLHPEMLKKQIKFCFEHPLGPGKIEESEFIAGIVPHAGYAYSGPIASWIFARIPNANYLIIGPNHNMLGSKYSLMKDGFWKTPLGKIEIHKRLAENLLKERSLIEYDVLAHQYEHSIEVQLPFLQYRFGNKFKFIPISVINEFPTFDFLDECIAVGKIIGKTLKKEKERWIVLASSDFSHYVSYNHAIFTDKYLIESIVKMDEKEFFTRLQEKNASVCGYGPIAITIIIAKQLGARMGKSLKYANSGDVTGDRSAVVGYASIIIY